MADQGTLQGAMVAGAIYQTLQEKLPEWAALWNTVPELRPLFINFLDPQQGWTQQKFAEELHKSNWYKTTPESARLWTALQATDPAEAGKQLATTFTEYARIASQEGVSFDFGTMGALVNQGMAQGWTDAQIRDHLIGHAKYGDPAAGQLDSTVSQLKATAAEYGIPISDQHAWGWAKNIRMNKATPDAFTEVMRQHAKSMFPALSDALDRGITVKQYADPYAQLAAQTLNINPNDFDISDPKWASALQVREHKGDKTSFRPLTLAEWQTKMMTDHQYGYDRTPNAQGAAVNLRDSLASAFGNKANTLSG